MYNVSTGLIYAKCIFSMLAPLAYLITAYVLGSFSCGVVFARWLGFPDPRTSGSKSTGSTNALRLGGKKFAFMVLVFDLLKGATPVFFAQYCGLSSEMIGWILLATMLGHVYPLFFSFKGGKGVATLLGGLMVGAPLLTSLVLSLWLLTARYTRLSSLASLVVATCLPLLAYKIQPYLFSPLCACAALLFWTHRDNIRRLREHQEPRF